MSESEKSRRLKQFGACLMVCGTAVCGGAELPPDRELRELAVRDSLNPVAPGGVNGAPFWNGHARRFIYAPAFDFKPVEGAVRYRFSATDAAGERHSFEAASPAAALTPVWDRLPVGFVELAVEGVDASGKVTGTAGKRRFYRAAVFRGHYSDAERGYLDSARMGLQYLFRQPHYRNWLEKGEPDPGYELYCYPTKIIASVVESMVIYAALAPADRETALGIARKAADYLISVSEPAGAPLEFLPPTYAGDKRTAKEFAGQQMMIYPADAASAYLDLYDACGERRFLEAALRIARSYRKLQLPSGSWYLKINMKDGTPVASNQCVPVPMIRLFERLGAQYGETEFRETAERAVRYLAGTTLKEFNWEGQFEDIAPSVPYVNNTKHNACDYALYLLDRFPDRPEAAEQARTLLRFAEDQFVVWEQPMPDKSTRTDQWITPCVLEQYAYYVPIDASAAKLISLYQAMYERTGSVLDLAKACELANAMTRAQDPETGRYLTYWERNERGLDPGWINCATASAKAMMSLGRLLEQKKPAL